MARTARPGDWPADGDPDEDESGPRIRKIRSVRLVTADDPGYVAAMAQHATANRRYGEKQDPGATYRASHVVEAAVLAWLAVREQLRPERVIAADVLPAGGRAYERLWLELDAVADLPDGGLRVHEVKFTTSANALVRGFRQLRRAARLLRSAWPRVETLLVAVPADGGTYDQEDAKLTDVVWVDAAALDDRIAARAVLTLDARELDPYLDDDSRALLAVAREEAAGAVRDRLDRRSRRAAGETVEPTARARRPAATLSFGDDADSDAGASPFAVLRGLRIDDSPD